MQDERKVMKHKDDGHLHFLDTGDCAGWGCYGCEIATPAEAERFRRDNTPTEAKGDGG